MQVEILSIPDDLKKSWVDLIKVGGNFPIFQQDLEDHPGVDFDWFLIGDYQHCLGDLIMNRIEFKVVHEKA